MEYCCHQNGLGYENMVEMHGCIAHTMGLVYSPIHLVDFYGFHVGKYTDRPMDPQWVVSEKMAEKHRRLGSEINYAVGGIDNRIVLWSVICQLKNRV